MINNFQADLLDLVVGDKQRGELRLSAQRKWRNVPRLGRFRVMSLGIMSHAHVCV